MVVILQTAAVQSTVLVGNQVNWQIDGVDNNDLWHNVPSVNQGGVEGIAGITLPLDSIEQYSQQTQSTAESGRNPGGLVNIVTKSGTNQIHGSLYYFNRNELFAANNPFANGQPKNKLRNQQYGVSFGGPAHQGQALLLLQLRKAAVHHQHPRVHHGADHCIPGRLRRSAEPVRFGPHLGRDCLSGSVLPNCNPRLPNRRHRLRCSEQLHQRLAVLWL